MAHMPAVPFIPAPAPEKEAPQQPEQHKTMLLLEEMVKVRLTAEEFN